MQRNFIKKFEEKCSYGKKPQQRTLEERFDKGVIIIDKDAGPTSHMIADFVKDILPISKSGHSGTLDPQVTGVLLVGIGRATRLMEYMLKSNKEYICLCYFHKSLSQEQLDDIFRTFIGDIKQLPPIVSAVKRQLRTRRIYDLELLGTKEDNKYVLFRVACQHGTYIRKLCTDMGSHVGMNAQMVELRRTKAGPLREEDGAISLDELRNLYELYIESEENSIEKKLLERELEKHIRPMEEMLEDFKQIIINDSALGSVSHGSNLALPGVLKFESEIELGEEVAVMTSKGELVAMGTAMMNAEEMKSREKGFCVNIHKVFVSTILE